jgi:hypothetical protein
MIGKNGVSVQPTQVLYLSEAPDIKQKAKSDRFRSPCGGFESIRWQQKEKKNSSYHTV